MHFILEETFVETHTVDVRDKPVRLRCAMMAKEIDFKIDNHSHGRKNQFEFGMNGQMKK